MPSWQNWRNTMIDTDEVMRKYQSTVQKYVDDYYKALGRRPGEPYSGSGAYGMLSAEAVQARHFHSDISSLDLPPALYLDNEMAVPAIDADFQKGAERMDSAVRKEDILFAQFVAGKMSESTYNRVMKENTLMGAKVRRKESPNKTGVIVHISGDNYGVEHDERSSRYHDCSGHAKKNYGWYYTPEYLEYYDEEAGTWKAL